MTQADSRRPGGELHPGTAARSLLEPVREFKQATLKDRVAPQQRGTEAEVRRGEQRLRRGVPRRGPAARPVESFAAEPNQRRDEGKHEQPRVDAAGRGGPSPPEPDVVSGFNPVGTQITGNTQYSILCDPVPAVAQIGPHYSGVGFILDTTHAFGNSEGQISCPGIGF